MQTIKIGEFEYSRTKIKNNILRVYADSLESEKNDWYREAHQWAVDVSNFNCLHRQTSTLVIKNIDYRPPESIAIAYIVYN